MNRTRWYLIAVGVLAIAATFATLHPWSRSNNIAFIAITTHSGAAKDLYLRGRDLVERHHGVEAQALFQEAAELDTSFAMAYVQLWRSNLSSSIRAEALTRAVALAAQVSEGERIQIMVAEALQSRHIREAGALLQELVENYPTDPRAHNDYGNFLFVRKNWAAAISQYLTAVDLDSTFSEPYNGLGYSYRYQGNIAAAERYFLKYLDLTPDDPNPYDSYGDLLTEMNRHSEAVLYYRKALEIDPSFTASHLGIAANYNMLGEFAKARDQLTYLIENDTVPDNRNRAMAAMGVSYAFEGNLKQAAVLFQQAADLARKNDDPASLAADLDCLGKVWLEAGLTDDAARAFVQALQAIQSESETLPDGAVQGAQLDHQQRMALVWLTRGNLESATTCATEFAHLASQVDDPAQTQLAHQTFGLIAIASRQLPRAVQELSQSDLTRASNQYYLALAFELSGNIPQALKYYGQATGYDQFDPLTHALVQRRAREKVDAMVALLRLPGRGQTPRGPLAGGETIQP